MELTQLTFNSYDDLIEAQKRLLSNNFNMSTSINKGNGYFTINDIWLTIRFRYTLNTIIIPFLDGLNYQSEIKKPLEYKIFNHGGYLD